MEKNIKDEAKALSILLYGIEDQKIRGLDNSSYYAWIGKNDDYKEIQFTISDSVNRANVFKTYTSWQKLCEMSEVGANMFHTQFLLFAHETDKERRNFYLGLIKDAVIKGYCPIEKEMNFILRTEMMNKGIKKFHEDYAKRIEEIRKEYNKPDYEFSVL